LASSPTTGVDIAIVLGSATGGGAERVSILLANALAQRGWSVTLIFIKPYGPLLNLVDPAVQRVELAGRRLLFSIGGLALALRRLRPKTVVSALVDVNVATVIAAKIASRRSRVILTEHNQTDRNYTVAASLAGRLAYRAIRFVYPCADRVICVSDGVRDSLIRFSGIAPDTLQVIHNPIVQPDLHDLAARDCPHPWLSDRRPIPVILGVGRLVEAKNFDLLLRAFAILRQKRPCRLVILGQGKLCSALAATAEALGIADDVDLPGFRPNPYTFLSHADLFVLPSDWEGFPTVLIEALACGARIVATDCPSGPREILKDGAFGTLVPVGDVDAFAEAMDAALDAPVPDGAVARGNEFTVDRAAERYEALIRSLEGHGG